MPYLGYVEVAITFPKQFLGTEYEVPTLALIVAENGASGYHILIGTNTFNVLYVQRENLSKSQLKVLKL